MRHTLTGSIEIHQAPPSRFSKEPREIAVYLPPCYGSASRRFPVLYLHDGQNLFDPATAFLGNHWRLNEVADDLIQLGRIEPMIMVGIYNLGERRLAEYTPVCDRHGSGGRARAYGRFIVEDLKPFVDHEYRTLPAFSHTGLGGSSLGGLVTLYLGLRYSRTFSKLAVLSPSVWWANREILKDVRRLRRKSSQKIWLDIGTSEGQNPQACVDNALALRDALIAKGWQLGNDLAFARDAGAGHDEKAWGRRMRDVLPFLYPPAQY